MTIGRNFSPSSNTPAIARNCAKLPIRIHQQIMLFDGQQNFVFRSQPLDERLVVERFGETRIGNRRGQTVFATSCTTWS